MTNFIEQKTENQRKKNIFRPEIQGLRALALFLVMIYHIWLDKVSGGVDVFFFISTFLLTQSLLKNSGKLVDILKSFTNILKKLLPSAALVILSVTILAIYLLTPNRLQNVIEQIKPSMLYYQNWFLIAQKTDYYATNQTDLNPLQHFWSLAIQMQVFFIWILIFLAVKQALKRIKKLKISEHKVLTIIFLTIFFVSFQYSIAETNSNPTTAYFDTKTRLWEFALGTLLALYLPYFKLNKTLKLVLSWFGVATIATLGIFLPTTSKFPGYIALVPLLATIAIILGAEHNNKYSATKLLSCKTALWFGKISYGIYLWHWPVLIFFLYTADKATPNFFEGVTIIALTITLATLNFYLIQKPINKLAKQNKTNTQIFRKKTLKPYLITTISITAIILTTNNFNQTRMLEINLNKNTQNIAYTNAEETNNIETTINNQISATQNPIQNEWADLGNFLCQDSNMPPPPTNLECKILHQNETPQKTVAIIGNSQMEQWSAAILPIAQTHNWTLIAITKHTCPVGRQILNLEQYEECDIWQNQTLDYLQTIQPDAVITNGTSTYEDTPEETIFLGFIEATEEILEQNIELIVIRSHPKFSFDMAECVFRYGAKDPRCNLEIDTVLNPDFPLQNLHPYNNKFHTIDMNDIICLNQICSGARNNTLIYKDSLHLTKTFVQQISPIFTQRIQETTYWW